MRKYYLPPILFTLAGIVCAVLRYFVEKNGYDAKGLPLNTYFAIPAMNIAMILFTVICIIAAISLFRKNDVDNEYGKAFASESVFVVIVKMLCAIMFLMGAAMVILDYSSAVNGKYALLKLTVMAVLAVVGFASLIMQSISAYNRRTRKINGYLAILLAAFIAIRILLIYFDNTANPVVISFGPESYSLCASCLFLFLSAGWSLKKKQLGATLFCGFAATLFMLCPLFGKTVSLGDKIICVSLGVYSTLTTATILKNLKKKI